ncbi:MAG: hypothetical protein JWP09_790 [Candidatus Taylorbacteria bacterium]|nr:hypothetical protein [Candidatus Taylorbacteria bacterium]
MQTTSIKALLAQIESLGGKQVADEVRARLAAESPSPDAPLGDIMSLITLASQPRLQQIQSVQVSPTEAALQVLVEQLRLQKGYVSFGGALIHRSVIIMFSYLITTFAFALPNIMPMLTSAKAGEPIAGLVGLIGVVIIGIILYKKLK